MSKKVVIKQNGTKLEYSGLTFKLTCSAVEQYLEQIAGDLSEDHGENIKWDIDLDPKRGYLIKRYEQKEDGMGGKWSVYSIGRTPREALMRSPLIVETMKRLGHVAE